MKIAYFYVFLFLLSCAGTDLVEDQLTSLEIIVPEEVTSFSGSIATLLGGSIDLDLQASSDLGGTFPYSEATWQSSDTEVATIDESGLITAVGLGRTAITASSMGITSNAIILTVATNSTDVAIIEVMSPDNIEVLNPGETLQLNAKALNASGAEITESEVVWSSSDAEIASIDENGLVTAINNGLVTITAEAAGVQGSFELTVGSTMSLSRSGSFRGINGYRTSGNVTLMSNDDGSLSLNLESNFQAQNGPGLYLYLSNSETSVGGGIEIAALRNTSGADSYNVPSSVELDEFQHVILYCKPFGVGFGTAELSN